MNWLSLHLSKPQVAGARQKVSRYSLPLHASPVSTNLSWPQVTAYQ
jgi:hypothetical protein